MSIFRFRAAWMQAALWVLLLGLGSSCQKTTPLDTTDYSVRDEDAIKAYIAADSKLTGAQRQASGLYVLITQPGTGPLPAPGQTIAARYTGTTLDGKVFDSTANNGGQPFEFPLGQGRVIAGWDQGFALLNKGAKAVLLIPSRLAYGPQAVGPIAANSVLRFDVEVVDIK